jgi:hypothetical protein
MKIKPKTSQLALVPHCKAALTAPATSAFADLACWVIPTGIQVSMAIAIRLKTPSSRDSTTGA